MFGGLSQVGGDSTAGHGGVEFRLANGWGMQFVGVLGEDSQGLSLGRRAAVLTELAHQRRRAGHPPAPYEARVPARIGPLPSHARLCYVALANGGHEREESR